MLTLLSGLIGAVALMSLIVAFLPFLGWLNWLVIPFAVVGAGLGFLGGRSAAGARNLCLFVIAAGALRLSIGGGII